MPHLLVTGGAGYIGAHTVRYLIASGRPAARIVVFDNLERSCADSVPAGVTMMRGDLREKASVLRLFSRFDIVSVLHLAAYTRADESVREPYRYYENNIYGSLILLEVARPAG